MAQGPSRHRVCLDPPALVHPQPGVETQPYCRYMLWDEGPPPPQISPAPRSEWRLVRTGCKANIGTHSRVTHLRVHRTVPLVWWTAEDGTVGVVQVVFAVAIDAGRGGAPSRREGIEQRVVPERPFIWPGRRERVESLADGGGCRSGTTRNRACRITARR